MQTERKQACSTGGTSLPNTSKTVQRCCGMYYGQTKPNRDNLPMLSGRNRRCDNFFFPLRFFCFRCGYRSTVPRGSKRRKNSRLKHLFHSTLMRQFFLPPLTSALHLAKKFLLPSRAPWPLPKTAKNKNSEVKTNEKSSLQHFQIE